MNTQEPHLIDEANGVFAVYKPSGMPTHPAGDRRSTLVDWLDLNLPGARPVHRLDLYTSGIVLCASDDSRRQILSQQLADRQIKKRYIALVHGRTRRKGIVRRPLSDARRRKPLPAVTRYNLVEWIGPYSLIRVRPETGRKHQIRRHLQSLGHAIVGDARYRPRGFKAATGFPHRIWLHAAQITLADGTEFNAPLPEVLEEHLTQLRAKRDAKEAAERAAAESATKPSVAQQGAEEDTVERAAAEEGAAEASTTEANITEASAAEASTQTSTAENATEPHRDS